MINRELFATDIQYLKGVGPKKAQYYKKLGVESVGSLLHYYPRGYIDLQNSCPVSEIPFGETGCVAGTVVKKHKPVRIKGGRVLYKIDCTDDISAFTVTFFNSVYAFEALSQGDEYLFYGKFGGTLVRREVIAPLVVSPQAASTLIPIYPLTKGLTSKAIAKDVATALSMVTEVVDDPLPDWIREEYGLCQYDFAMRNIHMPQNAKAAEIAKQRLIFEELLVLQIGMSRLKQSNRRLSIQPMQRVDLKPFYSAFPFSFTCSQQQAIKDIAKDFCGNVPMVRLLQGDVGSGKTAVAAAGIYMAAKNGLQSAMMAPTEILAEQHYQSLCRLLNPLGIKIVKLVGPTPVAERRSVLKALASGEADLAIGTHALITGAVNFARLGFVITDEQHRFGVQQRSALADKGKGVHMLVMSATPIPRTMALMIYGDLDLSVLREKPAGRQKIDTFFIGYNKFARALQFAAKQVQQGHQVYVVCPLVEEGVSGLHDAASTAAELQRVFPSLSVGLIHGKLKAKEKEQAMRQFVMGQLNILVSTTVIEVGVDVPNANLIVILDADRFGLSALHQLRGRVGRSDIKSYCILVSDNRSETARQRLGAMCRTNDGFELSNIDLKLRGPGDFFGNAQHGLPKMKLADLLQDSSTLDKASRAAKKLMQQDRELKKYPLLRQELDQLFASVGEYGLA